MSLHIAVLLSFYGQIIFHIWFVHSSAGGHLGCFHLWLLWHTIVILTKLVKTE